MDNSSKKIKKIGLLLLTSLLLTGCGTGGASPQGGSSSQTSVTDSSDGGSGVSSPDSSLLDGSESSSISGVTSENNTMPDSSQYVSYALLEDRSGYGAYVEISNHEKIIGAVTIPSEYMGKPVSGFSFYGFAFCPFLESVTIPDSFLSFSWWQLVGGCVSLKKIVIGSGVYNIDGLDEFSNAFGRCPCPSLEVVEVSPGNQVYSSYDGVLLKKFRTIDDVDRSLLQYSGGSRGYDEAVLNQGGFALLCCPPAKKNLLVLDDVSLINFDTLFSDNLESVSVSSGNQMYSSCDGVLYSRDGKNLLLCPKGKKGTLIIPDGVTSIHGMGLVSCVFLKSIVLGSNISFVDGYAFSGCTSLESIDVSPDNPEYSSLDGVLYSKDGKRLVRCPGGKKGSFVIPDGVTSIGGSAIRDCELIESISIPDTITSIGDDAFCGCSYLESVTIGEGVTSIGSFAFYLCSSLQSIVIPDGVTSIGTDAFGRCSSLKSVTIGSDVVSIGNSVFTGCFSLESINVSPENKTYFSVDGVLYSKDGKELVLCCLVGKEGSFGIPAGVASIGDNAFSGCSFESVTISEGVTSIGSFAFYLCSFLKSIVIPDSVASIGSYAFDSCKALRYVYYCGTPTDYKNISISSYGNDSLASALYYYSDSEPTDTKYNYWHYVNGVPTAW